MNPEIQKINKLGQSIWLDSISRGIINNGKLSSMISEGISGITSNPAIFQKALSSEDTYDEDIKSLINSGENNAKNIFQNLSIKDIFDACELLKPLYEKTNGQIPNLLMILKTVLMKGFTCINLLVSLM